jgi:uncharacterized alkaline shock family protein YloU
LANSDTLKTSRPAQRGLPAGKIEVRPQAIARVAACAAVRVEGVVGLVRHLPTEISVPVLAEEHLYHGVEAHVRHDHVTVDVYVVLRYGAPLAEIAQRVEAEVRAALAHALDQFPAAVRVRVQGVR